MVDLDKLNQHSVDLEDLLSSMIQILKIQKKKENANFKKEKSKTNGLRNKRSESSQ